MIKTKTIYQNKTFSYVILFLVLAFFSISFIVNIKQPIAADDLWWLVAAETLYTTGTPQQYSSPTDIEVPSPHLYLYLLLFSLKLFGQNETAARIPGIVSALISIMLIFFISKSLINNKYQENYRLPIWLCIFYASSAAIIQSSIIIDIDMTILVPLILILNFFFVKYHRTERIQWAVLSSIALCIAFWARITTPLIIASLFVIYSLLNNKSIKHKLIFIGAVFSGILFFITSWYLYCYITGIPFAEPFIYTMQAFQQKTLKADVSFLSNFTSNLIYFILWFGILPSLILFFISIWRCTLLFRDYIVYPEDFFLINGIILILGYTTVGGATFGFPKYQVPAIALICVFIGIYLSQTGENFINLNKKLLILFAIPFLIQIFIADDLLFSIRYTLREASALMLPQQKELLLNIFLRIIFFVIAHVVLIAACLKLSLSKNIVALLLILSVGSNIGLFFIQSKAKYYKGYNYGGDGTIETANYIRDTVPTNSTVIAPSEIIYYLNLPRSRYIPNNLWSNTDELKKQLDNPNTSGLAYSIATNTIHQIRTISFNQSIQETLNRNYRHTEIGSYTVWIRNATS